MHVQFTNNPCESRPQAYQVLSYAKFLFSCVMSKSTDMLNLNTAGTLPVSTEAPVICCSDLLFAKVQPIKRTNYRKGRWKEMTCVAAPKPSIK